MANTCQIRPVRDKIALNIIFSHENNYSRYSEIMKTEALLFQIKNQADHRSILQIGANKGRFEYAKINNKGFVFDFLLSNEDFDAILIEPIPEIFNLLVCNYSQHRNKNLHFLNVRCQMNKKSYFEIL